MTEQPGGLRRPASRYAERLLLFCLACAYLLNYGVNFGQHGRVLAFLAAGTILLGYWSFRFALAWFVFWIPFFYPDFVVLEALLYVLVLIFLFRGGSEDTGLASTPLERTAGLWAFWIVLSVLAEIFKLHSLQAETLREFLSLGLSDVVYSKQRDAFFFFRAALLMLDGVVLFRIVSLTIRKGRDLQLILGALILSFAGAFCYGLWQVASGAASRVPLDALFLDRNATAIFCLLVLSVAGARMSLEDFPGRASLVLFCAALGCLFLTLSLTGIFAGVVVLGMLAILRRRDSGAGRRRALSLGMAIAVLFCLFLSWAAFLRPTSGTLAWQGSLYERLHSLQPEKLMVSFEVARFVPWQTALQATLRNPWFGIGVGTFFGKFAQLRTDFGIPQGRFGFQHENAHHYFLQVAAELGLPGLLIFVAILVVGLGNLLRRQRQSDMQDWQRRLAAGVTLALSSLVLTSLSGHPLLLLQMTFYFWLFLAMANGITESSRHHSRLRSVAPAILALLGFAHFGLLASTPTGSFSYGFYGPETESSGVEYRWSGPVAADRVPRRGRVVEFMLRSDHPDLDRGVVARISVENETREFVLHEPAWLKVAMPVASPDSFANISFRVAPTWNPRQRGASDDRDLGVAVSPYHWRNSDLFVYPTQNFYPAERWPDGHLWNWMTQAGTLRLLNLSGTTQAATLSFSHRTLAGSTWLTLQRSNEAGGSAVWGAETSTSPQKVRLNLDLSPGATEFRLNAEQAPQPADSIVHNGDPRSVSVAIGEVELDTSC